MGIEVLGAIGKGVATAAKTGPQITPSLGGVRGGISALERTAPLGKVGWSLVNEGPVAPRFLENTMPLSLSRFNPEPKIPHQTISVGAAELPSGVEAVEIAEDWLRTSRPPVFEPKVAEIPVINPLGARPTLRQLDFTWIRPEVLSLPSSEAVAKPKNEPKIQPKTGVIEFSKSTPISAGSTELDKKVVQENPVGQIIVEKEVLARSADILVEEKAAKKPEVLETAEVEELKLKDLLDEETSQQRVSDISHAIDLAEADAKAEGVEEIAGPRILKFIRLHLGLISPIARKIRRDGSLDETLEELAARKFSSKNQAKQQLKQLVFDKEPVKRGKEGKKVKEGAVERVLKYHFVKRSPVEEVVKRVVKKQQIQTGHQTGPVQLQSVAVETKESRIEDYQGLAEVFKKAA